MLFCPVSQLLRPRNASLFLHVHCCAAPLPLTVPKLTQLTLDGHLGSSQHEAGNKSAHFRGHWPCFLLRVYLDVG